MKYFLFIALLALTGCAHKAAPKATIPARCILGARLDAKPCQPLNKDEYSCDRVVVKAACVKVSK